jgi:hypothetical protein
MGMKLKNTSTKKSNQFMATNEIKLIAEFMGYSIEERAFGDAIKDKTSYRLMHNNIVVEYLGLVNGRPVEDAWAKAVQYLNYENDWNQLIPIVEKIESLELEDLFYQWEDNGYDREPCTRSNFEGISVEIENNRCMIYVHLALDPIHIINKGSYNNPFQTKIEAVYAAVVEFIKWYNEMKENEDEQ